tara:strand:+ start:3493 stop:3921 length:429 start_codon:yes stop_codon:yes gene_type:complete
MIEIINVFLLSAVKFFGAPALAHYMYDFPYIETLIITTLGGIFGVFIFFYFGARIVQFFPNFFKPMPKNRKIFTKKNKLYVRLIKKYGLIGLALFSPVLISIPVGAFLAARFFSHQSFIALSFLCFSVLLWSIVLTTFIYFI